MMKIFRELNTTIIRFGMILLFVSTSFKGYNQSPNDTDSLNFLKYWSIAQLNVGGFVTDISSSARIGSEALGIGIDIDFEKAFGFNTTSTVIRGDALVRFGKKKRSFGQFGYFKLSRNSLKTLEADIEFMDQVIEASTSLAISNEIGMIAFSYGYTFLRNENIDIGTSFGFFVMPIEVKVRNSTEEVGQTAFIAPLPVFGLHTSFKLSPKLFLKQDLKLLYLKIDSFKGSIADLNIRLEYDILKNFGLGLGVNSLTMDVEANSEDSYLTELEGHIGYKLSGLLFYLKVFI